MIVLSYGTWNRLYGDDRRVLGKALTLNGTTVKNHATLQAIKRGAYGQVIAALESERGKLAPISGDA